MTILLAPLLLGQVNAAPYFDRSLAAHRALNSASVTVRTQGQFGAQKLAATMQVSYMRPDRVSLRVNEKGSDRSYIAMGKTFYGYDRTYNEYLVRSSPPKATLLDRLGLALQNVDEAVQPILEMSVLDGLFIKFKGATGWVKTEEGGLIRLLRYIGPEKNHIGSAFFFDKKTHLLRGVTFMGGETNIMAWRYEYGPKPAKIAFTPPASALKVSAFLETRPQPSYGDVLAKRAAEGSARAYDGLRQTELIVSSSSGKSHVWYGGGRVRERQGATDWSYADGVLTVLNTKRNKLYKGKATVAQVPIFLQRMGVRMDPIIRQLGQRKNPMRVMLHERAKVRRVGLITERGAVCDILQFQEPSLRISAWVRQKDRLLQSVETHHVDKSGRTVMSNSRDYQYLSVNKPLPKTAFQIGGNRKPLKLSQIGK